MGFSLRNFLQEAQAQANPFDRGKTAATVRRGRASQPARTVRKENRNVASRLWDQANPLDGGRTFKQAAPVNQGSAVQQAKRTTVNFANKNIVQPAKAQFNATMNSPLAGGVKLVTADITNNDLARHNALTQIKAPFVEKPTIPNFVVKDGRKTVNPDKLAVINSGVMGTTGKVPLTKQVKPVVAAPRQSKVIKQANPAGQAKTQPPQPNPHIDPAYSIRASKPKGAQPQLQPPRKGLNTSQVNDTTNVKVKQRGGIKTIPVKPITIPKDLVGDASRWNDVGSTLKTIDRNLEKAAPDEATYRKVRQFLVEPREQAVTAMFDEAKAIKANLKNVVDTYGLKDKEVRGDVMRFGEKKMTYDDLVAKHGQEQANAVVEADKWFRAEYDRLLNETNATLRKYGQSEIPRRENYYTHFMDDSLWSKVGLKLEQIAQRGDVLQDATAPSARGKKIDPKLLGQSEFTKPNKKWNPFAQQRKGDQTKYDAVEAFERYLVPTLHNKHLTDSVVRTRMLTKEFQNATAQSKNLPTFIRSLQEYGNHLSGKSNRFDRPLIESDWGGKALRASQYLQQQMGRNVILGSARSAVMQTAGLPQSIATAGFKNTALGAWNQLLKTAAGQADEVDRLSPFIRRRYARYDKVIPSNLEKAEKVAGAAFEAIEETVTKTIWRANHAKATSEGFKGSAAIREADRLTERVVGGRQIGERAEAFRSVMGNNFLQFQLEVNNMVQQMAQDWRGKPVNYVKFFAAAYVLNSLYEETLGDRPLPDVADTVKDVVGHIQEGNYKAAAGRPFGEVLSNIPGGSTIAGTLPERTRQTYFGDTEAGRYGSTFPAANIVWSNQEYAIPGTFGLGQAKRSFNGFQDFLEGKSTNKDGEVKYKIKQDAENALRAGLLGTYSTKEGIDYLQEKNNAMSGKSKKAEMQKLQPGGSNKTTGGYTKKEASAIQPDRQQAWNAMSATGRKNVARVNPKKFILREEARIAQGGMTPKQINASRKLIEQAKTGKVGEVEDVPLRVANPLPTERYKTANSKTGKWVQHISKRAKDHGLDVDAVLAVAAVEGLGGGVGDGGHAFGPFQLNDAGGVITGRFRSPEEARAFAESEQGIDFALERIAQVAKGKKGRAAIEAIVREFERPADPDGEIARALQIYGRVDAYTKFADISRSGGTKRGSSSQKRSGGRSSGGRRASGRKAKGASKAYIDLALKDLTVNLAPERKLRRLVEEAVVRSKSRKA